MNAAGAQLRNPSITDTVNNGINEFIFVLRRGNYVVPAARPSGRSRCCPAGRPRSPERAAKAGLGAVRGDQRLAECRPPVKDVAARPAAGDGARVEQDPQVVADRADRQPAGGRQAGRPGGLIQRRQQRRAVRPDEPVQSAPAGRLRARAGR